MVLRRGVFVGFNCLVATAEVILVFTATGGVFTTGFSSVTFAIVAFAFGIVVLSGFAGLK